MTTPPPIPTAAARQYNCPWCGHASDASTLSCPRCGAPIDVTKAVTHSGWAKLPPIRDMTRIQFGDSTLQIEGKYVPVADFNLGPAASIYFTHHLLLWRDTQINISVMPMKGGWKRLFAGLPLVMTQAAGPGRAAFSKDQPGELIVVPLDPGQSIDVREHVFMVATNTIAYDWFQTGIWFSTYGDKNSQEMHYPIGMFMDRFTAATGPGLALLHGSGNVFERRLADGESILIKPTSLLFKDPSVRMHLHIESPGGATNFWGRSSMRYLWLRLHGPGRVAVQSNYPMVEDPDRNLAGISNGTTQMTW
jgi:uncharacterized protein (AIM24 family)